MGAIFGALTVAAMPSIKAAVFVAGGIPSGGGIDDPPLGAMLLDAASKLAAPRQWARRTFLAIPYSHGRAFDHSWS
jgi:hypothetical protein